MQLKRVINILLQARLTRYLLIWFTFVFPTYRFLLSFLVFFRVFPNLKGIQLSFRTNLGFISEIYATVKKINERRNNLIYTYLTCTCITN